MNKQYLVILSIIGAGIFGIVYATSGTIITNTSITTPNLTVTGTCTGCGAGEGSYSNYNTVVFNQTYPSMKSNVIGQLFISNNGTVTENNVPTNYIISSSGSILSWGNSTYADFYSQIAQSLTGEYKVMLKTNGTATYIVLKNDSFVIKLGFDGSKFYNGLPNTAVAISPNGEYIAIDGGTGTGGAIETIVVLKGS